MTEQLEKNLAMLEEKIKQMTPMDIHFLLAYGEGLVAKNDMRRKEEHEKEEHIKEGNEKKETV